MLMTIHEAVMVEMGKVDREGNKIEKLKLFIIIVAKWVGQI